MEKVCKFALTDIETEGMQTRSAISVPQDQDPQAEGCLGETRGVANASAVAKLFREAAERLRRLKEQVDSLGNANPGPCHQRAMNLLDHVGDALKKWETEPSVAFLAKLDPDGF